MLQQFINSTTEYQRICILLFAFVLVTVLLYLMLEGIQHLAHKHKQKKFEKWNQQRIINRLLNNNFYI